MLCLTQPHIIKEIHKQYLQAGANILETNTFNSQVISLADYDMQPLAYEINVAAAKLAKEAIKEYTQEQGQANTDRFVAGAIMLVPSCPSVALGTSYLYYVLKAGSVGHRCTVHDSEALF